MDLYSYLEREFETGDYQKADKEWAKGGRYQNGCFDLNGLLNISNFFINQGLKIDRVLLGPWGFILRKRIENGDFEGVKEVFDIYQMKRALKAVCENDEKQVFEWLKEENSYSKKGKSYFSKKEKLKLLLSEAIKTGNVPFIQKLKEEGARLSAGFFEDKMNAPMMIAALNEQKEVIKYLLSEGVTHHFFDLAQKESFSVTDQSDIERKAELILIDGRLKLAQKRNDDFKVIKELFIDVTCYQKETRSILNVLKKYPTLSLNEPNANGKLIFEEIIHSNYSKDIPFAIDMGVDLLKTDAKGASPVIWASVLNQSTFFEVINKRGLFHKILPFIDRGFINALIEMKKENPAIYLIQNGFCLNEKDKYGRTPLMTAIEFQCKEVFDALLQKKLDFELQDEKGQTALFYALPTFEDKRDKYFIQELLKHQININHQDKNGNTALMRAIETKQIPTAFYLIEKGADVLIKNKKGQDAYHFAMVIGHKNMADKIMTKVKERLVRRQKLNQMFGNKKHFVPQNQR